MKKIRRAVIVLLAVLLLAGLTGCGEKDPYAGMTAQEKLAAVGDWEMLYDPTVKLSFSSDGTGSQVNGYGISANITWTLQDNKLTIVVEDIMDYTYNFVMEDKDFTVQNTDGSTAVLTFVYGGSQLSEIPDDAKKPTAFVGEWKSDNSNVYSIVFNQDGTAYRFEQDDASKTHVADLKWGCDSKQTQLYLYDTNAGRINYYSFTVSDTALQITNLSSKKTFDYNKQ